MRSSSLRIHHHPMVTWIGVLIVFVSLLAPFLAVQAADAVEHLSQRLTQGVPPECEPGFVANDEGTECVQDPAAQPPEEPVEIPEEPVADPAEDPPPTTEEPEEISDEVPQSTVVATEIAEPQQATGEMYRLTINVYRCDHPTFDPYLSTNYQMVLDQCVGPGSGEFHIESTIPVAPQTGSPLEFQIGPGLAIQEIVAPGYGDPIANCFVLDANGTALDQIGPGEANGGYWKVGNTDHNVHCDWYQVDQGHGVVYIVNMACPGPLGFPKPTLNELVAMCKEPAGQFLFGVQHGQIYSKTGTTGGEFNDVHFDGVYSGPIAIWGEPPAKFESARMFCQVNTIQGVELSPFAEVSVSEFRATSLTLGHDQRLHCSWFNIPEGPGLVDTGPPPTPTQSPGLEDPGPPSASPPAATASELRVRLHTCPAGYKPLAVGANPNIDCPPGPNGVTFTLTDQDPDTADLQSMTGGSIDNVVSFGALAPGEYSMTETVPEGTGTMFVLGCAGGGIDPIPTVVDGAVTFNLPPGVIQNCPWFNVPELGSAQQVAHEGTPGLAAALTGTDPESANLRGSSGDASDGAVSFGNLIPGAYTVAETVPSGTAHAFVLDCSGGKMGAIRSYPLSMGDTLGIVIGAGEEIVCHWYNVPEYEQGRLTLVKYQCSTMTFTSDVDCGIHEEGQSFDLVVWNGGTWEHHSTQTTDGAGQTTFLDLAPGEYWLDEHESDWCHMTSEQISDNGNWLNVQDGQETIVEVFNCSSDPTDQGKVGETPSKYPNTGLGPNDDDPDSPTGLPALAPIAGVLFLLARPRKTAPVIPARQDGASLDHPMSRSCTRRQVATGLGGALSGSLLFGGTVLGRGDEVTPSVDAPDRFCLPATPAATSEDECRRGAVPVTLRIDAIGVDAPIEILETVGGVMQQPSDEVHVAWYKETARLGEIGNILVGGHLNWWGVPEAVFFNLGTLQDGDEVVLLGEEEHAFAYEVEWVRQESNLDAPSEEVLGMTEYESVTLITCGGEWDTSINEYNERTVARARRVADDDG